MLKESVDFGQHLPNKQEECDYLTTSILAIMTYCASQRARETENQNCEYLALWNILWLSKAKQSYSSPGDRRTYTYTQLLAATARGRETFNIALCPSILAFPSPFFIFPLAMNMFLTKKSQWKYLSYNTGPKI